MGIPKAYGSYEALLADPDIQAIYNPLPNHLHVAWSIKALEAGKHVCAKNPSASPRLKGSGFWTLPASTRTSRSWRPSCTATIPSGQKAKQLVDEGQIGKLRTIQTFFSYYNADPNNIRNLAALGGGGMLDIGCYCISLSRWIFGAEPERVVGILERDPTFDTDRIASAILDLGGWATWTCSTQNAPYQRVNIVGTEGRVEIEIPFNAPPDVPCKMWYQRGEETEEIVLTSWTSTPFRATYSPWPS